MALLCLVDELCKAKVAQFDLSLVRDQHVAALEVSMVVVVLMEVVQTFKHLL